MKKRNKDYSKLFATISFSSVLFLFSAFAINFYDITLFFQRYYFFSLIVLMLGEVFFRGWLQPRIGVRATAALYALFFPLLIASSVHDYLLFCLFFLAAGFWLGVLRELEGIEASVSTVCLYFLFVLATGASQFFPTFVLSALFLSAPFCYFSFKGTTRFQRIVRELGISKENLLLNVLKGFGWTLAMFFIVAVIGTAALFLGLNDQQKVAEKIAGVPAYVLVIAVVFAPFAEEIFFRGFLCPRIGIIASSLLFALAHYSYGSIVEIIAAFFIGILLAIQFKRSRSLVVPITSHVLFNLISLSLMKFAGV